MTVPKTSGDDTISWSNDSEWIIDAQQDRSRKTTRKILTSAYKLFLEKGYESTTVALIAHHADIAASSIYRRFPDKDGILYVIIDSYYSKRLHEFDIMLQDNFPGVRDPEDFFSLYTKLIFSAYRADADFIRLLERRALVDAAVRARVYDTVTYGAQRLSRLLYDLYPNASRNEIERAMAMCHSLLHSVLIMTLLADRSPPHHHLSLDDHDFQINICKMIRIWFSDNVG